MWGSPRGSPFGSPGGGELIARDNLSNRDNNFFAVVRLCHVQISGRSLCKTRLLCTIQYYVVLHCSESTLLSHTHTHTHTYVNLLSLMLHTHHRSTINSGFVQLNSPTTLLSTPWTVPPLAMAVAMVRLGRMEGQIGCVPVLVSVTMYSSLVHTTCPLVFSPMISLSFMVDIQRLIVQVSCRSERKRERDF